MLPVSMDYTKTNKTKTIQRKWQHSIHNTKTNKTKTIKRNWQHSVHNTDKQNKNNPEKLAA
jgi:hypothetical protein